MKFYIATRFEDQERGRELRRNLTALGQEVTSSWLDEEAIDFKTFRWTKKWLLAARDLQEIQGANCLIALVPEGPVLRGGYHVEVGYALGQNKEVWLVGPPQNIFHSVLDQYFGTEEELLNYVSGAED